MSEASPVPMLVLFSSIEKADVFLLEAMQRHSSFNRRS